MIKQAFILAGGEGTRLRPVTFEIPKPLIPVQQKAVLTWQVEWLARHGVEDITVLIPPKWTAAFEKWRDGLTPSPCEGESKRASAALTGDVRVGLWVEPEPMGTLGALVRPLRDRVGREPFFVTNGDELKGFDLGALADFHTAQKTQDAQHAATIALLTVSNPSAYGVAELDGPRIARFHEKPEKPPSNFINSGLYVIEPEALDVADKNKSFLMFEKDLFPQLAVAHRLGGCPVEGAWFDCGTLERWEKAINEWKG